MLLIRKHAPKALLPSENAVKCRAAHPTRRPVAESVKPTRATPAVSQTPRLSSQYAHTLVGSSLDALRNDNSRHAGHNRECTPQHKATSNPHLKGCHSTAGEVNVAATGVSCRRVELLCGAASCTSNTGASAVSAIGLPVLVLVAAVRYGLSVHTANFTLTSCVGTLGMDSDAGNCTRASTLLPGRVYSDWAKLDASVRTSEI